MHLIFFDEAKHDPNYSHYHIGAVCIEETQLGEVEGRIKLLAEEAFGTYELTASTEFHAAKIYHRKGNFKDWSKFDRRVQLIGKLAEILSLAEVKLIDIQINTSRLNTGQSPEDIAFMYLCERANDFVKSKKALGMLIGDRENDRHAERFASTLSNYRAEGTDFAFGRKIQNLVDSVHFTHSHLSRFLQLADVYVWLLQFKNRNRASKDFRHQAMLNLLKEDYIDLSPSKYKEWPKS
jgi:Protein of unknown function (DUF3800)